MSLNNNSNFQFFVFEPLRKNNLSVFFLSAKEKKVDNYLCFSETLKKDLVSVNEVNERGSVRYLKISNKSNQKILVLESELINGNALKQDRVVDRTTLIPENTTIMLQVSCCASRGYDESRGQIVAGTSVSRNRPGTRARSSCTWVVRSAPSWRAAPTRNSPPQTPTPSPGSRRSPATESCSTSRSWRPRPRCTPSPPSTSPWRPSPRTSAPRRPRRSPGWL